PRRRPGLRRHRDGVWHGLLLDGRRVRRRFAAAALALGCGSAGAAEGAHWYLQLDNDVVASTDRWYTSGLRLARVHRAGADLHEWGVLQEIYTPEAKHYALGVVIARPPRAFCWSTRATRRRRPGTARSSCRPESAGPRR